MKISIYMTGLVMMKIPVMMNKFPVRMMIFLVTEF